MSATAGVGTYAKGYVGGAWWRRPSARSLAWRYLAAILLTVFFLFPVYWLFAVSLKTPAEIFASPPVRVPPTSSSAISRCCSRTATPGPCSTA